MKYYALALNRYGQFCIIEIQDIYLHIMKGCPYYTFETAVQMLNECTKTAKP